MLECGLELLQFAFAEPALNIDQREFRVRQTLTGAYHRQRTGRARVKSAGFALSSAMTAQLRLADLRWTSCELSPRFLIFLFSIFASRDDHLAFKRSGSTESNANHSSELRVIARPKG